MAGRKCISCTAKVKLDGKFHFFQVALLKPRRFDQILIAAVVREKWQGDTGVRRRASLPARGKNY